MKKRNLTSFYSNIMVLLALAMGALMVLPGMIP